MRDRGDAVGRLEQRQDMRGQLSIVDGVGSLALPTCPPAAAGRPPARGALLPSKTPIMILRYWFFDRNATTAQARA